MVCYKFHISCFGLFLSKSKMGELRQFEEVSVFSCLLFCIFWDIAKSCFSVGLFVNPWAICLFSIKLEITQLFRLLSTFFINSAVKQIKRVLRRFPWVSALYRQCLWRDPEGFPSLPGAETPSINIIITHADWLTEWGKLRARCKQKVQACWIFMFARVCTPSSPVRERERDT